MKNFNDMPDDFENNAIYRSANGIHRAGDYAIRIMKWMVRDIYVKNIYYYDLVGTALTYMKGEKIFISKEVFALIND